jgi:DNA modification methylase
VTVATWHTGDTRTVLATLPDHSVDLVLTSPPFLALRSYLPADHPDKPYEMGSEATPGEFIDSLLDVVEQCRRVLAPHGSICVELGDTYAGSGGAGGDYNPGELRDGQATFRQQTGRYRSSVGTDGQFRTDSGDGGNRSVSVNSGKGWPLDKSLTLIPEIFRFALVYGFNPLTGRTTERWRARNVVRWVRPNPPVGALGDKFRPATSDLVIACTARDRYFDLDAVRDSAPPLDWWNIPPTGYPGAHYATYPEQLCTIPIRAMCPLKVCTACGKPSRRITDWSRETPDDSTRSKCLEGTDRHRPPEDGWRTMTTTTGWTDCGHNTWRTGVVLDPFAGSGTTLAVAVGHGRDAIGIDLDSRNAQLAQERIGMFFKEAV